MSSYKCSDMNIFDEFVKIWIENIGLLAIYILVFWVVLLIGCLFITPASAQAYELKQFENNSNNNLAVEKVMVKKNTIHYNNFTR